MPSALTAVGTAMGIGTAVAYLDLDTTGFSAGLKSARSELSEFTDSSLTLSDRLSSLGSSMTSAGATLTKSFTLPIVALGTAAVSASSNFETSMSKVEAVSGATSEEMEKLRQKAIEMGASTKFSAKESADAFTYMAMAGWDAGQMIDGISGIMSLAAADGLDLATTSDIVTDALTAFGLQAKDSGHFADILATASSSANTNVSMLGESFKYIAPVAGALGMSVEDVAIALGLMANSGIKSTQAGTSLRASLTNLVKPTDTMAIKMQELGIEVTDSQGNMKSLMDIMVILRDKFSTLSEAEKANAAATLFGKESMSAMLAVINASEQDFNKLTSAIYGSNGAAEEMSEIMMDNLAGSITLLKSALESLMIKVGDAVAPLIRQIAEAITRLVEKLNQLSDEQIQQIVKIAGIVAAVGPLLIILGKVVSAVNTIITVIGTLGKAVVSVISIGSKLVSGVGTLITALGSINPVVLAIIAAIGALIAIGVALYKNWEEVSDWCKKTWESMTSMVSDACSKIGEFMSGLISSIGEFLSNAFSTIMNGLQNILSSIGQFFSNMISSIFSWLDNLISNISGFFSRLWSSISGFFDNLISNIGTMFSSLFDAISSALSGIASFIGGIFSTMWNGISNGLNSLFSVFNGWGTKFFNIGSGLFSSLWDGMKSIFSNLLDWIRELPSKIVDAFKNIGNTVSNIWSGITGFFSGSHANGLDYVPYDGYVAQLHQGERVLTKNENKEYNSGDSRASGGDTYVFNNVKDDPYEYARQIRNMKKELDLA